jgi:hypothetical protein
MALIYSALLSSSADVVRRTDTAAPRAGWKSAASPVAMAGLPGETRLQGVLPASLRESAERPAVAF